MHAGFKGNRVGISELVLREGRINYEIQFVDSEGVVHARMRHSRAIGDEGHIASKVDELVTALITEAAAMHFASPAGVPSSIATTGATSGIAEALGAASAAPDEPEGSPG